MSIRSAGINLCSITLGVLCVSSAAFAVNPLKTITLPLHSKQNRGIKLAPRPLLIPRTETAKVAKERKGVSLEQLLPVRPDTKNVITE